MDFTLLITLIGIAQGVFILSLILFRSNVSVQSKYILALIVVFIMDLSSFYLIRSGMIRQMEFLAGIPEATLFLYGPILYLYVSSVLNGDRLKTIEIVPHFIPAIIIYLLTSPLFFADVTFNQLSIWEEKFPSIIGDYSIGDLLFDHVIWYAFSLIYFVLCLRLLRNFRKHSALTLPSSNAQIRKTHLKWVEYLMIGYLAFPLVGLSVLTYNLFSGTGTDSFSILNFFMVFHIFSVSFIGFTNQELLINPLGMLKYQQSKMDDGMKQVYLEEIQRYFYEKEAFLNKNLTLKTVSDEIGLSSHRISQVINEHYGHGFNDFVNSYRIELAKEYILSPEKKIYTLEAIADQVGFKSKPTFNTAFKKKEGITPTEFKRSN